MNTRSTFFSLMVVLLAIGVTESNAQSRGNDRGRDRGRSDHDQNRRSHSKRDRDDDREMYARRNDRHDHDHHSRRSVHVYERHYHPVAVHHHRHDFRPRYVYYKDYDVYYDYTSSSYIYFSGRGWTISRAIPTNMRYVDVRRLKRYEIDYHDDNFAVYLDRKGRPQYGRECDW
jgi:hypothetical protein